MQSALTLVIIGVVLGIPGAVFSIKNPRKPGEPFSGQRKLLLGLTLVGAMLLAVGAVIAFSNR
jgi:hypothetical protein